MCVCEHGRASSGSNTNLLHHRRSIYIVGLSKYIGIDTADEVGLCGVQTIH